MRNEVQVVITVMAVDKENASDVLGTVGASAALSIPDVPFAGPVSSVRVGYIDGKYVVNPTYQQLDESLIDIVVAGTKDAIMMVEAGASEAPEEIILGAMEFAQQQNQILIELQEEIVAALKPVKWEFTPVAVPDELKKLVFADLAGNVEEFLALAKDERQGSLDVHKARLVEKYGTEYTEKACRRGAGRVHQEDGARVDPERRPAAGRAEVRGSAADLVPGGGAARPRDGAVHARADAGAERHDARRRGRCAAAGHAFADREQAVHAPLQLPAVLGG